MKPPIQPYSDEELALPEDMEGHIENLLKFFDETGIDYGKFDPNSIPKIDFSKKEAYPNMDVYQYVPGQHDTQKWLQAISDIYRKEQGGEPRVNAIRSVVGGWNVMETYDFLNWVKFHESGDHMKYKFAQLWFEQSGSSQKWYHNPDTGYALQIRKEPEVDVAPAVDGRDIDFAKTKAQEDSDRRSVIEKQRNKIIGRLDSAEKLLRSPDGHVFSGKEFETLLEAIYQLKKKIQMVNKISSSTRLYEDMIVREANVLTKKGFVKAANLLYSVAQTPAAGGEKAKGTDLKGLDALAPAPPADPSGAGNPGPPSGGAATPAQPPGNPTMPQSEPANTQPKGISDFLSRMDDGMYAPDEQQNTEDDLEVSDQELLVTEAQVLPEEIGDSAKPAPLNPATVAPPKPDVPVKAPAKAPAPAEEEPLEVTEDDIKKTPGPQATSTDDFDAKVDAVFSNITVADVVAKLEDLAKIFKTREVPRQLGIVDMMLDSLGLASYFPSLSEATNKALESNNYISTRVEDILSKLRGAMGTNEVDLTGGPEKENPEVAGIKGKLQEDADKEVARKKMRKEQESAELAGAGKETPEVEIQEDLAAPPAPAPAPAAPPKAPLA
jgi:hypothetical protein